VGGGESASTVRKHQLRWREQNPEAYRRMRARQKRRYYRQFRKNNRRRGKHWTLVEIERITAKNRPSDRELSKALGRSVQAIQRQRYAVGLDLKQGRLNPSLFRHMVQHRPHPARPDHSATSQGTTPRSVTCSLGPDTGLVKGCVECGQDDKRAGGDSGNPACVSRRPKVATVHRAC
jgi:hypothetical protein